MAKLPCEKALDDSGWKTLSTYTRYKKIGSVVYLAINGETGTANEWTSLGTLPTGYVPSIPVGTDITFPATSYQSGGTGYGSGTIKIFNTGELKIRPYDRTSIYAYCTFAVD